MQNIIAIFSFQIDKNSRFVIKCCVFFGVTWNKGYEVNVYFDKDTLMT